MSKQARVQFLCNHARTMCMMYEASGNQRYLQQARIDLDMATSTIRGFIRPFGVIARNKAA